MLLDNNITKELRRGLAAHLVFSALECGWAGLSNGELLRAAEAELFEVMITADKNIIYQQNNETRRIGLIVLDTNRWRHIRSRMLLLHEALLRVRAGSFESIDLLTEGF